MEILKSKSKRNKLPHQPDTGRRSFMRKIGAAMPVALAAAAPVLARPQAGADAGLKDQVGRLSSQLGSLEDENAIRGLHRTYENLLSRGEYEEVLHLFTDDAEVIFNGGVFQGKSGGVRRLYCERFKPGWTGKRIEPAPGFRPEDGRQPDIVRVSADRKSAGATFSCSIQVGTPIVSDSQLVKMARLHGEGIKKWWEGGTYEVSYVKDAKGGGWKIGRLEYRILSKADYKPGRSEAGPIEVPLLSKVYPEDPSGPDRLIAVRT